MSAEDMLDNRSDQRITDDVVAALILVGPLWVRLMDPVTLPLWVRDQLDELETSAREHGRSETGCMVVEYDAEEEKMRWSVLVAYRYDDVSALPLPDAKEPTGG